MLSHSDTPMAYRSLNTFAQAILPFGEQIREHMRVLHAYEHISNLSKCSTERSNLCMCGLDWMYKTAKGSS